MCSVAHLVQALGKLIVQVQCFVVRGEPPGCRLFGTASMFELLRNLLTHHSQWEQYGKIEPQYPLFLIIQWRWQRHLMWSATHDVMSREIHLWKSFDLLLGSNLWPLSPSAGCLTARPPELTKYNANCEDISTHTHTIVGIYWQYFSLLMGVTNLTDSYSYSRSQNLH